MGGVPASNHERYLRTVIAGRFLIDRLVGQGAFAWVFHACARSGQEVAVKVLHSADPSAAIRFARETQVLAALGRTPGVATYIEHGKTDDSCPYLVLEFVDGVTLHQGMLYRPILGTEKGVAFMAELCGAFVELHRLGVAHRDVKPENILLARTGGIKLIDFGLIRDAQGILKLLEEQDPLDRHLFEADIDRRVLVGTPEYMAPEQFSDSALSDVSMVRTDTWSDVFSLGVILYQLLSGQKPFPMRSAAAADFAREILRYMRWRTSLRDEHLPPCPGIDPALDSILRKSLRQDPRQRQPDAQALREDLVRYLATGDGVERDDVSGTVSVSISDLPSARRSAQAPASLPATVAGGDGAADAVEPVDGLAPTRIASTFGESASAGAIHAMETLITPAFVFVETIPEAEFGPTTPAQGSEGPPQRAQRWIEAPTIVDARASQLEDARTDPDGTAPATVDAEEPSTLERVGRPKERR
jgi:serine/threonine-protein kinase